MPAGHWFAPPGGGYQGHDPTGEAARSKGTPPTTPPTEAGLRNAEPDETTANRSTVRLKNPRPATLRDLTDSRVRQRIEDEALRDARLTIERILRRRTPPQAAAESCDTSEYAKGYRAGLARADDVVRAVVALRDAAYANPMTLFGGATQPGPVSAVVLNDILKQATSAGGNMTERAEALIEAHRFATQMADARRAQQEYGEESAWRDLLYLLTTAGINPTGGN